MVFRKKKPAKSARFDQCGATPLEDPLSHHCPAQLLRAGRYEVVDELGSHPGTGLALGSTSGALPMADPQISALARSTRRQSSSSPTTKALGTNGLSTGNVSSFTSYTDGRSSRRENTSYSWQSGLSFARFPEGGTE